MVVAFARKAVCFSKRRIEISLNVGALIWPHHPLEYSDMPFIILYKLYKGIKTAYHYDSPVKYKGGKGRIHGISLTLTGKCYTFYYNYKQNQFIIVDITIMEAQNAEK